MSDQHLHVRCDCSDNLHFVEFDVTYWGNNKPLEFNVFVCGSKTSQFLRRLRFGLKYIFGRDHLITADVVLTKAKAREICDLLARASA